jgi:DNA-binding transcriptional LysR family regulator
MVRLHSRLKMRHMLLLRTLGTTLNSRRAAAEMNISQPSASALLREIEDAVGTELFEREAHGLRPTLAGQAMIEWAGIILADLERASNDLDQIMQGAGSRIRVGLSPLAVPRLLPNAVRIFRESNPLTVISVQTGIENTLIPMVLSGDIDIAISRLVPQLTHSGLNYEILCAERACIVVRTGHELVDKEALTADDLDRFDWLLPASSGGPYDRVAACLVSIGAKLPKVVIESWSALVIVHMLQSTDLLTVLPYSVAIKSPTLRILPLELPDILYPVVLFTRPTPSHQVFLDRFTEAVRRAAGEM